MSKTQAITIMVMTITISIMLTIMVVHNNITYTPECEIKVPHGTHIDVTCGRERTPIL